MYILVLNIYCSFVDANLFKKSSRDFSFSESLLFRIARRRSVRDMIRIYRVASNSRKMRPNNNYRVDMARICRSLASLSGASNNCKQYRTTQILPTFFKDEAYFKIAKSPVNCREDLCISEASSCSPLRPSPGHSLFPPPVPDVLFSVSARETGAFLFLSSSFLLVLSAKYPPADTRVINTCI